MAYFLDFKPLIKSAYGQTVFSSLIDFDTGIESKTYFVLLGDGDQMAYEESIPPSWDPSKPLVILVHGLCGSHRSHYMKRIARKLYNRGYNSIRINLRGCGSGRGLARNIYHSGCSPDVYKVVKAVKERYPNTHLYLMGFSLGGNVSLKLAGELKGDDHELLSGVIGVSAPVDLLQSARLFSHPENHFYEKYFLKLLVQDVEYLHTTFKDLPLPNLPSNMNINDFDELYVAPRANFSNALDYYRCCSSKKVIPDIKIPAKILFALDDPIIRHTSLDECNLSDNIEVYKTKYGGHIGFMGLSIFKEFRWMDHQVIRWVEEIESTYSASKKCA